MCSNKLLSLKLYSPFISNFSIPVSHFHIPLSVFHIPLSTSRSHLQHYRKRWYSQGFLKDLFMRCLFCPALAWAGWRRERARCAHVRTIGFTNVFACPLCGIQMERKGAPRRPRDLRGGGLLQMLILPRILKVFFHAWPDFSMRDLAPSGGIANGTGFPTVFTTSQRCAKAVRRQQQTYCGAPATVSQIVAFSWIIFEYNFAASPSCLPLKPEFA